MMLSLPELNVPSAFLIGYILSWLTTLITFLAVRPTPITRRRQELTERVQAIVNNLKGEGDKVEIIFPNPMKEKFDAGTVTSISDAIED